ncbi:hypothetical protein [Lutibacter sp.]
MKNLEFNQMEVLQGGTIPRSGDGRPCISVGLQFATNFVFSLSFWLWDDLSGCWNQNQN